MVDSETEHRIQYPQKAQNNQIFFPINFNPNELPLYKSQVKSYLVSNLKLSEPVNLATPKASSLNMKRTSRLKCPCIRCCSVRVNRLPLPLTHRCMVPSCSKVFTHPFHLRDHLKSHEDDYSLECGVCGISFRKAELIISHMFEHDYDLIPSS